MLYAFSWILVLALLALWSLAGWALNAVSVWTISNAGLLSGGAGAAAGELIRLPDWLAPWVAPELARWFVAVLAGVGPLIDTVLQAAPALASGLTAVIWVVWGIGSIVLLALGVGAHLLIAAWRGRGRTAGSAAPAILAS